MAVKLQFRRDTAANWESENPILSQGELGLDLTNLVFKIGDGVNHWNNLVNYEAFDSSATYENLRAKGTTATDVGLGNVTNESKATMFTDPTFTGEVSGVTAAMVDLGNVTNESKATMFTDAALTGIPTAPTAAQATNSTQIATTEFVASELSAFALGLNRSFVVADIAERDALTTLNVGDFVFVADNGDAKWAQYKLINDDPNTFIKIMDQDIMLNALNAPDIKAAYESNADTNAFTDAEKANLANLNTDKANKNATIEDVSANYTVAVADSGKVKRCTNSGNITVTVPSDSVALPIGSQISFLSNGTGAVSFAAGSGATLVSNDDALTISGQYSSAVLLKLAANSWQLIGSLE